MFFYCYSIIFIYLSNNSLNKKMFIMEIKITNNQILKVLEILSWIIFIGLCIDVGSIIVNTFITLFINSEGVVNFWKGADYLTGLYNLDSGSFSVITIIMIIVGCLKAIMFYFIIQLFTNKTLNYYKPFSLELREFIVKLSYLSLGIGFFSHYGSEYSERLTKRNFEAAHLENLNLGGADVWLFMAVILFIIVYIVKKGIEIQTENELTI